MLNSTKHESSSAHKNQNMNINVSYLKPSGVVFILLINVKMPTIVSGSVEHEKFYDLGPGFCKAAAGRCHLVGFPIL